MNIVSPSFRSRVGQVTPRCLTLRTYHRPKSQDMKIPCSIDSTFVGTANPNMTLNYKTLQVTSQSIQNAANHVMIMFSCSQRACLLTQQLPVFGYLFSNKIDAHQCYAIPLPVKILSRKKWEFERCLFGFVCNSLG